MDFSYLNRESLDLDWVIEKIGVFFQYLKGKDIFCYLSSKVLYYLVEKTGELYIYIYPLQGGHLLWLKYIFPIIKYADKKFIYMSSSKG